MERLLLIKSQINSSSVVQKPFVSSGLDYLHFNEFLTAQQKEIRIKVRRFVDQEISGKLNEYIEKAVFPSEYLLPKLRQLDMIKYFFKEPFGENQPTHFLGVLLAELSRGDAGISTFMWLEASLAGFTIQTFGSQKQKQTFLPQLRNLDIVAGWSLTEKNVGSDAASMETTVHKDENNRYFLNGNKRWIGNGNGDYLIVWARNLSNKQVEGFIIPNTADGVTSEPIRYKLPLRMVQNCQITFKDVQIKDYEGQKLEKSRGFSEVSKVLKHSRMLACWIAIGIAMGVYDRAIEYVSHRQQFGQSISSFQLVQEKVVKIMSNLQGVLMFSYRMSQLVDQNQATMGQIGMAKSYVTERVRKICEWGRQVMGGNGILFDNYVMKALADIEGIYTYEGTYDINTLVAGRQLTGMSAFGGKKTNQTKVNSTA